jgi:hypothetical protein
LEPFRVFIGFDPREADAYRAAEVSLRKHSSIPLEVQPLILKQLVDQGVYDRPTERRDGKLWDVISGAPMSTEFALTRFLVPELADYKGWALFLDCDFLFREDVAELLSWADDDFALMCVHHVHRPKEKIKMDGQKQTSYQKKNWSSLMLWNCGHLLHAGQVERVKRWPGLWLHQFRWLPSESIGALPERWNWLEGSSEPAAVHYTRGVPSMSGYESSAYADEWRECASG